MDIKELEKEVVEMRKTGATYPEIRKAFGLKEAKVASILRKHGMTNNKEVNNAIEKRKQQENIEKMKLKEAEEKAKEDRRKLEEIEKIKQEKMEKEVVEMRKTGATYRQIKRAFGLSESKVWKILSENGMTNNEEINKMHEQEREKAKQKREQDKKNRNEANKAREKEKKKLQRKVIKMRSSGKTQKQIAEKNNICVNTVSKILKANGMVKVDKEKAERDEQIVEMRKQGMLYKEIQKKYNISENRLAIILMENNMTNNKKVNQLAAKRRKQQIQEKANEETKKQIIQMKEKGKTNKKIAEEMGVTEMKVHKILKEANDISVIVKQKYEEEKVDINKLSYLIEENHEKITIKDINLAMRIFTRQGQINQAIRLINCLIRIEGELNISKEQLTNLVKNLEDYRKKMFVRRSLDDGKTVSQISEQMRLPSIEVIRIKKEWEQMKAKEKDNKDIPQGWGLDED